MRELRQARCGIKGCGWVLALAGPLCARLAMDVFLEWRKHLTECHGLKPDTKESSELRKARLYFDMNEGEPSYLTVIDTQQTSEWIRRAAKAWLN